MIDKSTTNYQIYRDKDKEIKKEFFNSIDFEEIAVSDSSLLRLVNMHHSSSSYSEYQYDKLTDGYLDAYLHNHLGARSLLSVNFKVWKHDGCLQLLYEQCFLTNDGMWYHLFMHDFSDLSGEDQELLYKALR